MARIQLSLNVSNLDGAVDFYSKLFATEPTKRKPGYANFAIIEPPLKLVLIEKSDGRDTGVVGALNHLGIEVESSDVVSAASLRLAAADLDTVTQVATTCCYALQDKVWVHDPDEVPWEIYSVIADAPNMSSCTGCCTPSSANDESMPAPPVDVPTSCC